MKEEWLPSCRLCPRECAVDRNHGKYGYCGQTAQVKVARAALHFWEEPCISGEKGSGTVFFSGCPLRCIYCQNRDIALGRAGKDISVDRLAEIFLQLQEKKANNINLVTPTHFVVQIVQALVKAKKQGLHLPVVYNTSAYEKTETIRMLDGLVDVYLPDLKYADNKLAARYSNAPDYFETASLAIKEMVRQVGKPVFVPEEGKKCKDNSLDISEQYLIKKGVIVRHLVLPEALDNSKSVIRYLYETYGNDIYMSIMNQYTPIREFEDFKELNRQITEEEYEEILDYAIELGVENAFIQEGETARESFIPAFDGEGV